VPKPPETSKDRLPTSPSSLISRYPLAATVPKGARLASAATKIMIPSSLIWK